MEKTLIYVVRKDLRVSDNVVYHSAASAGDEFTSFIPLYVCPAHQMDLSGFVKQGEENPYKAPRSQVAGYPRCGPHRAKFIGNAVWELKESLKALGSNLIIRVGNIVDVVRDLAKGLEEKGGHPVGAVWMTSHEGSEEKADEKAIASLCEGIGAQCKIWVDEKYFVDDRDVKCEISKVDNVFTNYRKECEPLRERPRAVLPAPVAGSLPKFPESSVIPSQMAPFVIPETLDGFLEALVKPVASILENPPKFPDNTKSAHPFEGGETKARQRLNHLIRSGGMRNYHDTRKGLFGTDYSTKLSAYLAQGCITARQIHHALLGYENGTDTAFEKVDGYGAGENESTAALRFELMWRDHMRLCHRKIGDKVFHLEGIHGAEANGYGGTDEKKNKWKTADKSRAAPDQNPSPERIAEILERFKAGTTGMGLIDAAQRELLHTGYTSNRARQNVANFLAKHLDIDWRYGAEWYEFLLVDYDVSSNWGNWQYVSGVGNDPRGEGRIFNPIKQAFDYDKNGDYVRSWMPEVSSLANLENVFQACTASAEDLKAAGLEDNIMVTDPVKKIEFSVNCKPSKPGKRPFFRRRGRGGGGGGGGRGGGACGSQTPSPDGEGEEQPNGVATSSRPPAAEDGDRDQSPPAPTRGAPGSGHRGSHRGANGGYRGGGRGQYPGPQRNGYQGRGGYRGSSRGHHHANGNGNGGGGRGNGFRGGRGGGGENGYHRGRGGAGRGSWLDPIG